MERHRFSVVRDFCGHGIGRRFHEPPNVLHFGRPGEGPTLQPGMFFTVEPMVNAGRPEVKILDDGWTAVTRDRSLSAQFEHMVGVTETGVEIFTLSPAGMHRRPTPTADDAPSRRSIAAWSNIACRRRARRAAMAMRRKPGLAEACPACSPLEPRAASAAPPGHLGHRARMREKLLGGRARCAARPRNAGDGAVPRPAAARHQAARPRAARPLRQLRRRHRRAAARNCARSRAWARPAPPRCKTVQAPRCAWRAPR